PSIPPRRSSFTAASPIFPLSLSISQSLVQRNQTNPSSWIRESALTEETNLHRRPEDGGNTAKLFRLQASYSFLTSSAIETIQVGGGGCTGVGRGFLLLFASRNDDALVSVPVETLKDSDSVPEQRFR
ncbi:hypothetical protein LINPERHAP1_LOCUS36146, partial [Linum perenne]